MKMKGISWIEQHVEKIVLATVAVIFLVVLAMQFLWQPNRIRVGQGEPLPPGRAFEPAIQRAQQIEAAMRRTQLPAEVPPPVSATLVEDFRRAAQASLAPSPRLARLGPGLAITAPDGGISAAMISGVAAPVGQVSVPAPTGLIAHAYRSTIDPMEAVGNRELAALLPAQQPFDKISVSVQGLFDGVALRAALAADPDGPGPVRAMPQSWWIGATEILGARLERQERRSDGSWSEATTVPPVPGRPDLLSRAKASTTPAELAEVIAVARERRSAVLRPEYLRTIAGVAWSPPERASKAGDGIVPEAVERLLRERLRVATDLERVTRQLEQVGQRQPGGDPGLAGGGGGRGGRGGGAGGAPPPTSAPGAQRPDPAAAQRQALERRIKEFEDRLAAVDAQIRQAGGKVPGEEPDAAEGSLETFETPTPLLEAASLTLWAHDLTAQPGRVYRYRLSVAINNPAFGRGATLPPDQQALATSPVMFGTSSVWTQPVEVPADRYFFVTSASPADATGAARASVEVYQFFYGFYRRATVSVESGDVIAATDLRLPDRNRLPIWDIGQFAQGLSPSPAGGGAGEAPAGGRGGGRGLPDELTPRGGGRGAEPPQTASGVAGAAGGLPAGASPWTGQLDVAFDAYLLDVVSSPQADGAARVEVLLGSSSGIIRRSVDEQRTAGLLRMLQRSARDGENQGEVALPQARPAQPIPTQVQPTRPAGGGGGGGGGGGN